MRINEDSTGACVGPASPVGEIEPGWAAIRRAYFRELGRCGPAALRFGVRIERLEAHLTAGGCAGDGDASPLEQLDQSVFPDLVLAVACIDQRPDAWAVFRRAHEAALLSLAGAALGEADATLMVRQLLRDVRSATLRGGRGPTLRRYLGREPLEEWLADRLAGRLWVEAAVAPSLGRGGDAGLGHARRVVEQRRRGVAVRARAAQRHRAVGRSSA